MPDEVGVVGFYLPAAHGYLGIIQPFVVNAGGHSLAVVYHEVVVLRQCAGMLGPGRRSAAGREAHIYREHRGLAGTESQLAAAGDGDGAGEAAQGGYGGYREGVSRGQVEGIAGEDDFRAAGVDHDDGIGLHVTEGRHRVAGGKVEGGLAGQGLVGGEFYLRDCGCGGESAEGHLGDGHHAGETHVELRGRSVAAIYRGRYEEVGVRVEGSVEGILVGGGHQHWGQGLLVVEGDVGVVGIYAVVGVAGSAVQIGSEAEGHGLPAVGGDAGVGDAGGDYDLIGIVEDLMLIYAQGFVGGTPLDLVTVDVGLAALGGLFGVAGCVDGYLYRRSLFVGSGDVGAFFGTRRCKCGDCQADA